MTQTKQRGIPSHITSCSAIKQGRRCFREVSHLLLGKWLGIGLPMGGGKWLPLHHSFCLLTFILPFIFQHPTEGKEGREVSEQHCGA